MQNSYAGAPTREHMLRDLTCGVECNAFHSQRVDLAFFLVIMFFTYSWVAITLQEHAKVLRSPCCIGTLRLL